MPACNMELNTHCMQSHGKHFTLHVDALILPLNKNETYLKSYLK